MFDSEFFRVKVPGRSTVKNFFEINPPPPGAAYCYIRQLEITLQDYCKNRRRVNSLHYMQREKISPGGMVGTVFIKVIL